MKNLVIDFKKQSVEFKFMVTNREVVTNSNLRQDIQAYGIAQDLIVMPIEEYEGEVNDSIGFKFGEGELAGVYVVIDGQHRLACLNDIVTKIAKISADNETIKDEKKKKTIPTLTSTEIPLKIVDRKYVERFGGIDNYIIMLNNTGKKWSNKDFIVNAYQRNEESFELRVINRLTEDKMSISTISRWLSGNTKVINNKSLQRLVKGETISGIDTIKAIKLYLALYALGFSKSFLNKRYMIDAINDLMRGGEEEKTLLKLSKITSINEIEASSYANGDVIMQIKTIINADYDKWRRKNNIGVNEESEAVKQNTMLDIITKEDIEAYLKESQKVDIVKKTVYSSSLITHRKSYGRGLIGR